tara:strand:- start:2714 stop:4903 length:2190 start_codon:yes stop_codon:yes gene_type:complete
MSKVLFQGEALSLQSLGNGLVELCFNLQGASVNKFSLQTVSELGQVLSLIESDKAIAGLLIISAKKAFIVGADITEFSAVFSAGPDHIIAHLAKNNNNFNRIEDLHCPTVVAIAGFALGGGMELCLACDYRIGSDDAVLGQPEVKLGIIPGWGGTVRLPRLCGLDTAVDWIASGREQKSDVALKCGVLDAVVASDQLRCAALHTLHECVAGRFDYTARRKQKTTPLQLCDIEAMLAFESSKAFVAMQAGRHYPAPVAAIKIMQKAASMSRPQALAVEAEGFAKMAQTEVAQSLVALFVRDQYMAKKAKKLAAQADCLVTRVGILGAGIMGGGVAYQTALKNVPVVMKDVAQLGLNLGLSEAAKILSNRVKRGRMTPDTMAQVLNRIEPTLDYAGISGADLVVEAVVEKFDVKASVLAEAEQYLCEGAVLASNTSTISITTLAKSLQRPEQFCGMHFFNPVHRMPLVEVIRGDKTADETIAKTVAFATQLGKKVVVVNDCAGFLINRVLFPYFAGFTMLVRDGADYRQIDKVMQRWGWPMGPAYLLDVVGVDTVEHAEKVIAAAYPERMGREFTSCIDLLYQKKRLGQKTGAGFYNYISGIKGKPEQVPADEVFEILRPYVAPTREFSDEEILTRMMVPMATELVRCLEEGVVATPAEADMALVYGLGFPAFRGGLFHWLDGMGLPAFCRLADPFAELGPLYKPTDTLRNMAAADNRYHDSNVSSKGGVS